MRSDDRKADKDDDRLTFWDFLSFAWLASVIADLISGS